MVNKVCAKRVSFQDGSSPLPAEALSLMAWECHPVVPAHVQETEKNRFQTKLFHGACHCSTDSSKNVGFPCVAAASGAVNGHAPFKLGFFLGLG